MSEQLGSAVLTLGVNAGPLHAGMAAARAQATRELAATETALAARMKAAGARMSTVGRSMQRHVSLPALAAAGAAGKLAFDFADTMNEIRNLVGASEKQLRAWERQILRLGPELGKAPKELADALYFVVSSGIDASKALGVVESAAKASALGLGETETVADAVTSAMNAYGPGALSAARATEILLQTVKEGKGEPAELAGAMGRVIPIAAKLRVPFEDVGAAIASMTLQGLDAAEATTALRGIMTAILKPAGQSEKALRKIGLSAGELRQEIANRGTLGMLQLLTERVKGNEEAFGDIFPNVRALVGAFNLTGGSAEKNAEIFRTLREDTDQVGKGFRDLSKSEAFQLRQDFAKLQAAGIKIGAALLPVAEDLASVVTTLAAGFASMPKFARDLLIGAIVLGPAVRGLGALATGLGSVLNAIGALTTVGGVSGGSKAAAMFARGFAGFGLTAALVGTVAATFTSGGFKDTIEGHGVTAGRDFAASFEETLGPALRKALKRAMDRVPGAIPTEDLRELGDAIDVIVAGADKIPGGLPPEFLESLRELAEEADGLAGRGEKFERFGDQIETSFAGMESIEDIRAIVESNMAEIVANFGKGSEEANFLTRRNFFAARDAIRKAMDDKVITVRRGQKLINELIKRFEIKKLGKDFEDLEQDARKHFAGAGRAMKHLEDKAKGHFAGIEAELRDLKPLFKGVDEDARKHFAGVARSADKMGRDVEKTGRTRIARFAEEGSGNFFSLAGSASSAIRQLAQETNKTLRSLKVKEQIYEAQEITRQRLKTAEPGGLAFGGLLPGYSRTDDRVIAVRGGEAVLTPETHLPMVDAAMRGQYGFGVTEMFRRTGAHLPPGFAEGGIVGYQPGGAVGNLQGGFNVDGADPGFVPFMNYLHSLYGPIYVMSGLRPGAITTYGTPSRHGVGEAVDISTSEAGLDTSQGTPSSAYGAAGARMDALHRHIGQYFPWEELLWQTWDGGNHWNHIHAALSAALTENPEAMAKLISGLPQGKGFAGAFGDLPRFIVEGPDGPLKDLANAAIRLSHKAAVDFLSRHANTPQFGTAGRGVDLHGTGTLGKRQLVSLWQQVNRGQGDANLMAAIALGESSGNPQAIGDGGDSIGLWQINMPAHPQYSRERLFDPAYNAAAAGDILRSQGLTAWTIYNNGTYRDFLRHGGFVDLWGRGLAHFAKGGMLEHAGLVGASYFDDRIGNVDNNLYDGGLYYAELGGTSFGAANLLGGLPQWYEIDATYKGTTKRLTKADFGFGGGDVKGKRRRIDIHETAAKALKFPYGLDLIEVRDAGQGSRGSARERGESNFKPGKFRGLSRQEEIAALLDILGDKDNDLNKKGRQEARDRLKELREAQRQAEARRRRRRRRRRAKSIKDELALSPYGRFAREAAEATELAEEQLADLESIHGTTGLPDDVPSDEDLLGPDGPQRLADYNAAVELERAELQAEAEQASQILLRQVMQRNTLVTALAAAARRISTARHAERRLGRDLTQVERELRQERRRPRARRDNARIRRLVERRRDLHSALDAHSVSRERLQRWVSDNEPELDALQGTGRDRKPISLDQIMSGYLDTLPLGRFGGGILATQTHLVSLGKEHAAMAGDRLEMPSPDSVAGAGAGTDSDLLAIERELRLDAQRRAIVAELQMPIYEDFARFAGRFHRGGTLPGRPGEEVAFVGLAGETIRTEEQEAALQTGGDNYFVIDPLEPSVRRISREEYDRRSGEKLSIARRSTAVRR